MKLKQGLAALLALSVSLSLTVCASAKDTTTDTVKDDITSIFRTTEAGDTTSKDETVYVLMDADGGVNQIIVSDWLQNNESQETIEDESTLSDVQNVKGDETYTVGQGNAMSWAADGSDIYYQGTATAALPVDVTVSYELDGQPISAADLEGKSGKVKIHFDYQNNEQKTVEIDGEEQTVYVPFVMATGMLLDTDSFSNVTVTNGKLLSDANHTAVIGIALPGLQESLDVDPEDLEIPSSVEVTADVTDFSLMTTLSVAIPVSMDHLQLDGVSSFDDLKSQMQDLVDGTEALVDGSSELYDGLDTLLSKCGELTDGVDELADGAKALKSGAQTLSTSMVRLDSSTALLAQGAVTVDSAAGQLADGASTLSEKTGELASGASTLSTKTTELSSGLGQISAKSGDVNSGAKQVFDTLLSTANTELAAAGLTVPTLTIDNYAAVLSGVSGNLSEATVRQMAYQKALETVTASVNASEGAIRLAVEAQEPAIYVAVLQQIPGMSDAFAGAGLDMTYANYQALVAGGAITADQAAQIDAAVASAVESQVAAQKQTLIDTNMASAEVQNQIQAAVTQAAAGQNSVDALKAQLDAYHQFYQGVLTYTASVDQAAAGASQLAVGVGTLASGSNTLAGGASTLSGKLGELAAGTGSLSANLQTMASAVTQLDAGTAKLAASMAELQSGIGTLQSSAPALVDGVSQLKDGAGDLKDGMETLNEEGIQKIQDLFAGDLGTLVTRLRAIADVAGTYNNYSGLSSDMDGTVKFVYKTAAIGD
ncbi:MAG: hypothetical protein VB055_01765 [Oscillospiraceae bacterium]|nr:hypothetical protein [Oscillospiraceae bacterium]